MNLRECLAEAPYAALLRLARHHGVPIGHDVRRAAVLAALVAAPLVRQLQREVDDLRPSHALQALQQLVGAGGQCPRTAFEQTYGSCIVPRTGAIRLTQVGAWLAARGLVFALPDTVVVPVEILAHIPLPPTIDPSPTPPDPGEPLYDLTMLILAAEDGALPLDRRDGRPLRRAVARLATLHAAPLPPDGWLLLADLALALGLLAPVEGLLRPGPALDAWLTRDAPDALQALWQGWLALPDRRRPSAPSPACRACPWLRDATVQDLLVSLSLPAKASPRSWPRRLVPAPRTPVRAATVVDVAPAAQLALHLSLPCVRSDSCPLTSPAHHALALLNGPLAWLGVCTARLLTSGTVRVTLTSWGVDLVRGRLPRAVHAPWRLGEPERGAPDATGRRSLRIRVAGASMPSALWKLAAFARPVPGARQLWAVEPSLLARPGLAATALDDTSALLETMSGRPLPAAWTETIASWAHNRPTATLRPVLLLESASPLPATVPPLSTLASRTLSPRAAVVDRARIPALRRALARRGIHLAVDDDGDEILTPTDPDASAPLPVTQPWRTRRRRVALAVGLDLLDLLDALGLPTPPRHPADREALGLSEHERAAVRLWRERLRSRLRKADASDDEADVAREHAVGDVTVASAAANTGALIEQAIADGYALDLSYQGRDGVRSQRVVTPHRVETRRGRRYLHAYCHDRHDDRTFRLDRIRGCAAVVEGPAGQADQRGAEGVESGGAP